jgi:rhamnopyranosyl-N-acetylglucosaminyl-diphospho-decaprenol beta-1,3/1,4-galactofuranosyltransferase
MSNTIAAIVVTFNRKQLLTECVDALLAQAHPVNKIIVIDNDSADGTPEFLQEKGYLDNPCIEYVRLAENTGGAGGFHEGVKRAYEMGYEWIWLMDDDAEPGPNTLKVLAKHFETEQVSALASMVVDPAGISLLHRGRVSFQGVFSLFHQPLSLEAYHQEVVEIDMASFVGILVNRKSVAKIGLPKKEFFIQHDDLEYCLRLRQAGKILLITDSVILHKEQAKAANTEVKFMGKRFLKTPYEKYWLKYFMRRNLVWTGKKYTKNVFVFYLSLIWVYLKDIVEVLLFNDQKLKRVYFLTESCRDGLTGNFDNLKPKLILYE